MKQKKRRHVLAVLGCTCADSRLSHAGGFLRQCVPTDATTCRDVIDCACANYAAWFLGVPPEDVDADTFLRRRPSLGIAGWSDPALVVLDNGFVDSEMPMHERQERSLGGRDVCDDEDVENQNMQIIKLIAALGEKDNCRRAILKAMAMKQGMFSDQDVDDLLKGSSERRLHVPRSWSRWGHGTTDPV